jgi:molybdopterin converting factor small subunit
MAEMVAGSRVADVVDSFARRAGGRQELMRSIAVAVNRDYARLDQVLQDGDEVALLPPVSGGVL